MDTTHGEQEDVPLERQKRLSKPITLISLSVDNHTNIISYLMTYVYLFYPISCNIIVQFLENEQCFEWLDGVSNTIKFMSLCIEACV